MEQMISVSQAALPVFIAILLGMLCRKIGFLSRPDIDSLKKVVLNITLPAVLFQAFAAADYTPQTLAAPALVFALCGVSLGLGFLTLRIFHFPGRTAAFLASSFEAGMLGYALFALLFPGESAAKFAILDLGQTLFVFTVFKTLLSGKTDRKAIVRDMVSTPILWAVAAGVLFGATGLYSALGIWGVSGLLDGAAGFVAAPTGFVILLTVGYDLVPKEIPWKKTAGLLAMRLGVMAVFVGIMVLLNRTLLGSRLFEGAIVLMAILPPPYVIPIFADNPEERTQISSALSAMTLTCLVLFALLTVLQNIG